MRPEAFRPSNCGVWWTDWTHLAGVDILKVFSWPDCRHFKVDGFAT